MEAGDWRRMGPARPRAWPSLPHRPRRHTGPRPLGALDRCDEDRVSRVRHIDVILRARLSGPRFAENATARRFQRSIRGGGQQITFSRSASQSAQPCSAPSAQLDQDGRAEAPASKTKRDEREHRWAAASRQGVAGGASRDLASGRSSLGGRTLGVQPLLKFIERDNCT